MLFHDTSSLTEILYWVFLILFGLCTDVTSTAMKVQVNKKLFTEDRLSWWYRNYSRVLSKHREFYPRSYLPSIFTVSSGLCTALVLGAIIRTFLRMP